MKHPPPFDIDRLVADELASNDKAAIQEHIDQCRTCSAYFAERESERNALLEKFPPDVFSKKAENGIGQVVQGHYRQRIWGWSIAGAVTTAVVVLLLLVFQPTDDKHEGTRWMGDGAIVHVILNRDNKSMPYNNQHLHAGDRLRYEIVLPPGKQGYATLLGIEGMKVWSVIPQESSHEPYAVKGTAWLPGSVEIESGGLPVLLWLFVREDKFSIQELINEVKTHKITQNGATDIHGLRHRLNIMVGAP